MEDNFDDKLWFELVLTIIYIKNSWPTRSLANNLNLHKAHFYKKPDLLHLQILDSTMYRLLNKDEHSMKSK